MPRPPTLAASGPAEFGRAWLVVLAAAIGIGVGVASTPFYSAGLFLKALTTEFGWSRASAAGGGLALSLGIALAAPIIGRLVDRFGTRPVATVSMLILSACFLGLSRIGDALPVYIAAMFLMGFAAAGSSPVTFTRAVSSWFARARGLALGLALVGTGATATLAPVLLGPLIAREGWRHGYFALALIALVATPIMWLVRDQRGGEAASQASIIASSEGPRLRGDRQFWILVATSVMAAFTVAAMAVSLVPILTDRGMSGLDAAGIAGIMGLAVIVGRIVAGAAFDRIFAPWIGAVMLALAGAGGLFLLHGGPGWSSAAAAAFGLALGAEIDLMAYLTARYFPMSVYGRVYSLIYASALVGAGLGPIAAGAAFDRLGTYDAMLVAAAAGLFAAAVLMLFLGPYPAAKDEGRS